MIRPSFPLHLALRYLRSTRRDAFVSFLSAVATGGIALGVAALVLSLAALSGFQRVLSQEVLARSPKLEVILPAGATEAQVAAALEAVRATPGVQEARPVVHGAGWIVSGGGLVRPVDLVGFAGTVPASFPGSEGRPEGLYVDSSLAAAWGLEPGSVLEVVSPHPTLVPFGPPQPRIRSLPLAGTFERPRTQEDRPRVALPLEVADTLLPDRARRIEVDVPLERAVPVAARLEARLAEALPELAAGPGAAADGTAAGGGVPDGGVPDGGQAAGAEAAGAAPAGGALGEAEIAGGQADELAPAGGEVAGGEGARAGLQVRTWREINRSLFFVLRLEKAMMFVAVSLIVLVAALALVADLSLIVSSKRSEIGMLGAMGASPRMLRRAFLLLGGLLAGIGATAGTLLGVGGAWLLDRYEVIGLPGDVYVFDHVPFSVRPVDLAAVLALTVALAALFSLYAARRAAALDPVEALRR